MTSSKKRILVAHPILAASGGGNGVAAWALEALRDDYDVTLATLDRVDLDAVNRTFGTSLREGDFRLHLAPRSWRLRKSLPTPGALLDLCLTMRLAQDLDREQHFDVLIGTNNEADFGRRGIQYVHHPWVFLPRPVGDVRWFHHLLPGFLDGYRLLCQRIARSDNAGLRRNRSLANSQFIAGRIRAVHGVDSTVLHPPVAGGFPEVPWERRVPGFVAIGRLHGCKRWDLAVSIVEEVRRRAHDVTLTLIGNTDDPLWFERLRSLAAERPWFRLKTDLSRQELTGEVARHRFGIHTMESEHFGMAPAEIQRAGCIVFAHNSGGPIEIVGADPRLLFDDLADAVDKIARVLTTPAEEASLRHLAVVRGAAFSEARFCASLREIVRTFSPSPDLPR